MILQARLFKPVQRMNRKHSSANQSLYRPVAFSYKPRNHIHVTYLVLSFFMPSSKRFSLHPGTAVAALRTAGSALVFETLWLSECLSGEAVTKMNSPHVIFQKNAWSTCQVQKTRHGIFFPKSKLQLRTNVLYLGVQEPGRPQNMRKLQLTVDSLTPGYVDPNLQWNLSPYDSDPWDPWDP